jgi:hypothetical protein
MNRFLKYTVDKLSEETGASGVHNRFKSHIMKKLMDLVNDTIKVALYMASYTFSATDTVYATTYEVIGTGYTAGGATLATKSVTEAATAMWDADDTAWTTSTFSCNFAVLYDVSPCNTLICAIDFGGTQTVTAGTFTIQYASSGILRLT